MLRLKHICGIRIRLTFLSLILYDISVIDPRHFTGSLKKYIGMYKTDVVVAIISGGSRMDAMTDYEKHKNLFGFR